MNTWDDDVSKMEVMFWSSHIDPFKMQASDKLVQFASRVVTTDQVEASMIGTLDKGMEMAEKVVVPNGD